MHNLHKEYTIFLRERASKERAQKEKAYLYSDLKHYGVAVWQRRKFIKQYQKQISSLSKKRALQLVKFYWDKPSFEEKSLALTILNLHKDNLAVKEMPLIERLMRESKGWAFLDSLIIPVMPAILEKDDKAYRYLSKWIKDSDYWVRRSALLAQVLFLGKTKAATKHFSLIWQSHNLTKPGSIKNTPVP